jgi:hypothetical protein
MDAAAGEARSGKLFNFSEDELIGDMNGSLGESEVEVRIICVHIRCDSFLSILFWYRFQTQEEDARCKCPGLSKRATVDTRQPICVRRS